MEAILQHRTLLDLKLLLSEFPHDWAWLAVFGFLGGVAIAFFIWYRSAVPLLIDQSELQQDEIESLEARIESLEESFKSTVGTVVTLESTVGDLDTERDAMIRRLGELEERNVIGASAVQDIGVLYRGEKSESGPRVVTEPEEPAVDDIFPPLKENESGNRVVFIVDVSDSMKHQNKLKNTRNSLRRRLNDLDNNDRYQVVFFAQTAWFADQNEPVGSPELKSDEVAPWREATDENIEETIESIMAVKTQPYNEWDLPFLMAMKLNPPPKRIDFLTDGEKKDAMLLAGAIIKLIERVGEKTQINTIAMMNPRSSPSLYRMSEKTGGSHTLVLSDDKTIRDGDVLRDYLHSQLGINLEDYSRESNEQPDGVISENLGEFLKRS